MGGLGCGVPAGESLWVRDRDGDGGLRRSGSRTSVANGKVLLVSAHLSPGGAPQACAGGTQPPRGAAAQLCPAGQGGVPSQTPPPASQSSGIPVTLAGWATGSGHHGGLCAGEGAQPLLAAHLPELAARGEGGGEPSLPFRTPPSSPVPLCHGHRHPAHLAGTAGAGLSLGGEGLAVHHLPTLVVAVCGERGSAQCVVGGSPGWGGGQGRGPLLLPPPPVFPVPTVTDGATLALGMEGVGAEDGTVHGRAGHRAQLRETGETREDRALEPAGVGWGKKGAAPQTPGSFFLQWRKKLGLSPRGRSQKHLAVPGAALTRQMQLRQGSRTEGKVSLL